MSDTAWTINSKGEVWTIHKEGGGELYSPANVNFAQEITVGADGTVWIISTELQPHQAGNIIKWLKYPDKKELGWVKIPSDSAAAVKIADR